MNERYETMAKIQRAATERFELYKLAGQQRLTDAQRDRLARLDAELPQLWDEHRREVAASNSRMRPALPFDKQRSAA